MALATTQVRSKDGAATGLLPQKPHRRRDARKRTNLAPLWLLSPAGLLLAALTLAPIVVLVFISFTDYGQRALFTGEFNIVGLRQYESILVDPGFLWSLLRTILFTVAMVLGTVAVGMAVAQLMTRLGRAMRYAVTVVLIFAWAVPTVASSLLWVWLFQPGYGVVNWILTQFRIFGDLTQVAWLSDPTLAYVAIWLLVVWHSVPFIALTLYAAQSQVPAEYFEAARLDGASEWKIYWGVTLPFLRPTLLLLVILSTIWDFNIFNDIWLVSRGGPGDATSTLGIWTFKKAFVGFQLGEGAAIAVVTTVLLMVFTAYYIRHLVKSGEDL